MNNKWFLKSKSILGVIIVLLVQIGPMIGISFTIEDGALLSTNIDQIATSLGALLALAGRVGATTKLTLLPGTGDGNSMNSSWLVSIMALGLVLLLSGCLGGGSNAALSPQTQFYQIKSGYAVAKEEAANYASQPFCSDIVVVACAQPKLVVQLSDASHDVEAQLAVAEPFLVLLDPSAIITAAEQKDKLQLATVALRQLTVILALTVAAKGGA